MLIINRPLKEERFYVTQNRKEDYLSYKSSRKGGRRISYAVKKIITVFHARKSKLVFQIGGDEMLKLNSIYINQERR